MNAPTPKPAAQPTLVTYEQITQATACPDCASEVRFIPMQFPGHPGTVFAIYLAHNDTCPQHRPEETHG